MVTAVAVRGSEVKMFGSGDALALRRYLPAAGFLVSVGTGCPRGPLPPPAPSPRDAPEVCEAVGFNDVLGQLPADVQDNPWALIFYASTMPIQAHNCTPSELAERQVPIPPSMDVESQLVSVAGWQAMDGHRFYAEFRGVPQQFDLDAYMQQIYNCDGQCEVRRASSYAPPHTWHVSDGPNLDHNRPDWWTVLVDQPGMLLWVQEPSVPEPCGGGRASGALVFQAGQNVWAYKWSEQFFFPEGGCGG